MRIADHIELSFSNLRKRKLRTFLTAFGVTIGIGALVAMVSFGLGMQKNITESFEAFELFNSITVFSGGSMFGGRGYSQNPDERPAVEQSSRRTDRILDDKAVEEITKIKGVVSVFPEIRIPVLVRFHEQEEFRLIQVVPAKILTSNLVKFKLGKPYVRDDEDAAIISSSLLRQLKVKDPRQALGQKIQISSIGFDFSGFNPLDFGSFLGKDRLPFSRETYEFIIVGITETMAFSGPTPITSDVYIPPLTAQKMKKLPFTNIWDLFRAKEGQLGYSALNIRLSSPKYVDSVKGTISEMGFDTFALLDQFRQIRTSFVYMDMFLAAIGMIAIFVASLGIINTMVMSILERYQEIGIMKAVGASDGDIKKIFFFESSAIGFLGGIFGLALGWIVSRLINQIVNYFLAKQGVPYIEYFNFPWWLCLGAILFAIAVSLGAGIYPAIRAARVDPVRALRHD